MTEAQQQESIAWMCEECGAAGSIARSDDVLDEHNDVSMLRLSAATLDQHQPGCRFPASPLKCTARRPGNTPFRFSITFQKAKA